jgi:hypothetical protein
MDNKRIYITIDEQKELEEVKNKYHLDENAQLSCKKYVGTNPLTNKSRKRLVKT